MPGEGDLDVTGFMRAVAATGYAGPLSLEIFNDQFRGGLPRLVAEDGGLRVTLNGAETGRTLAGRFISDSLGASVQHIAFACADIFATAAALAARGFPALAIGANYYDDVEARFGLDPELTAQLRAANLLYDEDTGGRGAARLTPLPWRGHGPAGGGGLRRGYFQAEIRPGRPGAHCEKV